MPPSIHVARRFSTYFPKIISRQERKDRRVIAQAETELLTGDLGDGVTATITPPNEIAAESGVSSAHVLRLQTRVANIETRASILGDIEAQPVAELVIFAMDRYYSCDPYQKR